MGHGEERGEGGERWEEEGGERRDGRGRVE